MQATVLLVFAALCWSQVGGIPRDEFFLAGTTRPSQTLSKGDARSSGAVDLGDSFVFFGQSRTTIYVNTDGLLSFGAPVTQGTPQRFPYARPLIAPFWANADTSSQGDVYYMQSTSNVVLQRAASEIQSAFSNFPDFEPTVLFVATWNEIGLANSRSRLTNTFQAVLATNGTNSFVMFLYADDMMQWTNDDIRNPGAQVGFNPGGGRNGFSLPTSLTQYTLNVTVSSNIGKQGVWIFRVDSPQIELPGVIIGLENVTYSVQEGVGSVSICARLIGEEMEASVTVETQDVLSLADRDYTDTTLELDFSGDIMKRCFSIDVTDDDILETEETFAVVLTTENTDIALLPQMALVVIEDDDTVTVGHLQPQWIVTESEGDAFVCVQAHSQTERPINVQVSTRGGTATIGEDYLPVSTTVTIPPGSSPATCGRLIPILDDSVLEQSEFINVVLETEDEDVEIDVSTAAVIIQDNDGPSVSAGFIQSEFIVGEDVSSVDVCVRLTGEIGRTISIIIETVSFLRTATVGLDYLDIHENLIFTPENSTLTRCLTIVILEDGILEDDETFFVQLRSSDVTLSPRQASIIIQDNDDVFVQFEQYEYFVNEFTGQLRVCATLTGRLESAAPISFIPRQGTARPTADYNPRVHNLNFRPPVEAGQPVRPVCANIFVHNDFVYENHTERFFVELQSSLGSVHVENRRATVYIVDNDAVFVTFTSSALALEVAEGGRTGFICIFYPSGTLEVGVEVSLNTVDGTAIAGSDYNALSQDLTFRPLINGNTQNTFCDRLVALDDSIFEGNESFSLVLSTRAERVQIGRRRTEANTEILPVTILDDDMVTVQHKEQAYVVREDAGSVRVCAVVTGLSENNVGVSFTTRDRDNGAVAGVDYDSVAMETFIRAREDEACVSIPIRDNQVQSSVRRKSFDVVLRGANPLIRVGGQTSATVTITDDDVVTVGVAEPGYSVEEGAGSVTVCVTKTGEASFGITGRLTSVESAGDLATASLDYTLNDVNSSFIFPAGGASRSDCMEIPILDDSLVEGTEVFQVQVSLDENQPVVIDRTSTTITIADNDVALVGFQESEYSIGEEDGSLRVCVDLEGRIERDITVDLATRPMDAEAGMDYVALSTQLVFQPSETSVCADVSIISDEVVEDMESFQLLLNTTHSQVTVSAGQAVVRVVDDDSIAVRLEQSVYSVTEDVNFIQLCLSVLGDFSVDVPVTVSTEEVTAEGDEDYLDLSRTLLFSPTGQQSGCVDIEIRDDDILEDSETFDVLLSSPNPAVRYITNQSARIYITDNDRVTLGLRQSEYIVGEETGAVEVCVDLQGRLGRVVPIMLESSDPGGVAIARSNTDYEELSTAFEFQPSRTATSHSHCFNVSIRDDDILEDTESFTISLSTSIEAADISVATAQVDIVDNDAVSVSLETAEIGISEGAGFVTVCARLTGAAERDVSLDLTTQPGTAQGDEDYLDLSRTLLFSPTGQQSGCVDIEIRDDDILEDSETFDVLLSSPNPAVRYITNQSARIYITDNDRVTLGLRQSEYIVGEEMRVVEVCVDLQGRLGRVVPIMLESSDPGGVAIARSNTDYEELSTAFEFQPSRTATSHSHCFNVSIRDDDILEDTESFTISLSTSIEAADISVATTQVDIVDNDAVSVSLEPEIGISEGAGFVTVCARLTGAAERDVSLDLTTLPGTAQEGPDYSTPPDLGFQFGPSEDISCANVSLVDDTTLEHDEGFSLSMTSSDPAVVLGQTTTALVIILDDDTVQAVFELEEFAADEDDTTVSVCVTLQGTFDRGATVTLTTVDGDTARAVQDYSPLTMDVTFAPAENPRHCVSVSLTNDIYPEETENFWVELSTIDSGVVIPSAMVPVVITDADIVCPDSSTDSPRGDYTWEQVPPFTETLFPCTLGPLIEGGVARRTCGMGGVWEEPRLRECRGNLDELFALLAQLKFSKENLAELALAIMQATRDNQTNPEYLSVTTRFLQDYSQLVQEEEIRVDTVSFVDVLKVVDLVQEWPVEVLHRNSSQIVFSTEGVSVGLVNDVGPFTHTGNSQNLAFRSYTADAGTLKASGVGIFFRQGALDLTTTNPVVTPTDDPGAASIDLKEDTTAALFLPSSVFSKMENSRVGLFFSVYDNAVLFPLNKTEDVEPLHDAIGTNVVAATVAEEKITGLSDRIMIALRLQNASFTKPRCVSWDFEENFWTETGCKRESAVDGVVTCSCNHLTNFAVLVDISGRTEGTQLSEDAETAIEIVSLVGVVISLVGLILTVITLVAFKKLRQKDSTKFRVQLCIALALMMVVFVVGIDRTQDEELCVSVSVVLHYFTLVSVLWMAGEAVLMFRKLVFVFSLVTKKFIVIVSLVCWLLPLPAVIVPVLLDRDYVISEDYCFISHNVVFFVAFLGPIFAVLLFNFIIFAVVVTIVCIYSRRKNRDKERGAKRQSTLRTLASLTGVMVLFGLTWVFAAFTVRNASIAFQFLFAVFNSLQGFFIFLFFVVLSKDSRELWLLACGCKKQKVPTQATATTNSHSGSRVPSRAGSLKVKFPEFDDSDMEAQVNRPFNYWDVQYIIPPRLRWNISFSHSDTTPSHSRQVSNASPDLQTPMDAVPCQLGRVDESAEFATQQQRQRSHMEIKAALKLRTSTPIGEREDSFTEQDTGIGFTPSKPSAAVAGTTTDAGASGTARKTKLEEANSSPESSPETRRKEKLFQSLMQGKLEADNTDSGLESQSSSNDHLPAAAQSVTPPSEEAARCASAGPTYDPTEADI